MVGSDYYKKYIGDMIAHNPTVITIKRTEEQDNGYGGTTTVDLPPFDLSVMIYKKRSNREIIDTSGMIIGHAAGGVWKLLASGDADIKRGDTFTADGTSFKVAFVNNFYDICKQVELEAVSYV
jgi:hypothetical protein